MNKLQDLYPSLTLFSDLDWEEVAAEYESAYPDLSFPEYLQQKSFDGDCPPYLFEIAFYELARHEVTAATFQTPYESGYCLNPVAAFLSLEFDVPRMLAEASQGEVNVHEEAYVLAIYKKPDGSVSELKLSEEDLSLLELVEDGPIPHLNVVEAQELLKAQLILHT
jgi:hypothetical protein